MFRGPPQGGRGGGGLPVVFAFAGDKIEKSIEIPKMLGYTISAEIEKHMEVFSYGYHHKRHDHW